MFNKQSLLANLSAFVLTVGLLLTSSANAGSAIPDSAFASTNAATAPLVVPPAPDVDAKGFVLMDANTGQILASKNMDQHMAPASLTKMMTLYIISNALTKGQIHLNNQVPVSDTAWKTGGSRMFIQPNTTVSVEDLIQGIIVDSGNDATVAMAEYLAGSESSFVPLMNQQAQKLGMKDTHYMDCNGLPDEGHYTSPHDIALLARQLVETFPQYYHWYSQKWFTYNGIRQPNRNRLLWRDSTVDGIKTGHTSDAGYCLVASAKRDNMRLISVIMGAPSDNSRANDNQAMLNYGFRFYKSFLVYHAGKPITQTRSWLGVNKNVALGAAKDVYVTLPVGQYPNVKVNITVPESLRAPIMRGKQYGNVTLTLNNQVLSNLPLVALQDNPAGNIFSRMTDYISLSIHKMLAQKHS